MHARQLEVTLPEDSTLSHYRSLFRPLNPINLPSTQPLTRGERCYRKNEMCCQQHVINSPLMIIVKTWLYCKFYNERPYQPCFSVTEIRIVSIYMCVCVCLWAFMCLNVFQEREGREEKEANGWGQAELRNQPYPPRSHPFVFKGPLPRALPHSFAPPPLPAPPSLGKPLDHSLLILPKHIVLFALHVLKVKVAARHTFVDVLDVVASGLEVSGGIIGPRGEDLGKMGKKQEIVSWAKCWHQHANTLAETMLTCRRLAGNVYEVHHVTLISLRVMNVKAWEHILFYERAAALMETINRIKPASDVTSNSIWACINTHESIWPCIEIQCQLSTSQCATFLLPGYQYHHLWARKGH